MFFWLFMLVISLLSPAAMICFGKTFSRKAPEKINPFYGYRTAMSMKNRETWEYAHHYFGRLWYRIGLALLMVSAIVMLPVFGKDADVIGNFGTAVCLLQLIPLTLPIFLTELELRKKFDSRGIRK